MSGVAVVRGSRRRVSECADCERVRPIVTRGLCGSCRTRHQYAGTITRFGYVKADRMADYAQLRMGGASIPVASARLGVTARTGQRYENELAAAGLAPWRGWPGAAVRRAA